MDSSAIASLSYRALTMYLVMRGLTEPLGEFWHCCSSRSAHFKIKWYKNCSVKKTNADHKAVTDVFAGILHAEIALVWMQFAI